MGNSHAAGENLPGLVPPALKSFGNMVMMSKGRNNSVLHGYLMLC